MSKVFGEFYTYNTVVGYENNKVIVKQDDGLLFFCEMPDNLIVFGETMDPRDLQSIKELPVEEQKYLIDKFKDVEV